MDGRRFGASRIIGIGIRWVSYLFLIPNSFFILRLFECFMPSQGLVCETEKGRETNNFPGSARDKMGEGQRYSKQERMR
jgi:hypothetical protein